MAPKKNFDSIKTGAVYNAIRSATNDQHGQQDPTAEEKAQREEEGRTQGRKGCRLKRINLALAPSNYDFVKVVASASGNSMSDVIGGMISAYKAEHPEILEQAQGFLDAMRSTIFVPAQSQPKATAGEDNEA